MGRKCLVCHHPKRIDIEKVCLTKKTYSSMVREAKKIDPALTRNNILTHFHTQRGHQMSQETIVGMRRRFSALEALDDIISRGVGKVNPRASDVVAAARVKGSMELEERRMNQLKEFLYRYAIDPQTAAKDPRFAQFLPEGFKPGKVEPIKKDDRGKDTSEPAGTDTDSKE